MPKPMSGKAFSNLLDYYIACLTQEDLLSVTFNVSSEGSTFLSTPFHTEKLFHTHNTQVSIQNSDEIKRFFQTSSLRQKEKTLYYGYPLIIGPQGMMSPLFFSELTCECNTDQLTFTTQASHPTLNHYVLSQQNYSPEEIKTIKQDLEAEPFQSALHTLCDLLHISDGDCSPTLDTTPFKRTIDPKLKNKAILYYGERTDITQNLLAELLQLKNKPIDELASTSLFLLLTQTYPARGAPHHKQPLLEIYPLNHAQQQAVHESLHNPLTVITGPPGTGKSQVVLNIIANAVIESKTVLFASKNNKAVDVVIQKLTSILPYNLVVRMGHQTHRRNAKTQLEQLINQPIQTTQSPQKNKLFSLHTTIIKTQEQLTHLSTLNDTLDKLQSDTEIITDHIPEDFRIYDSKICLEKIDALRLQDDIDHVFHKQKFLHHFTSKRNIRTQEKCFKKYYDALPLPLQPLLQNLLTNKKTSKHHALQLILTIKKQQLIADEITQTKKTLLALPAYHELKNNLAHLQKEYITVSQLLFKHHWVNIFAGTTQQDKQQITRYFSISEQLQTGTADEKTFTQLQTQRIRSLQRILRFLPVWVVTNLSAKQSFPLKHNLFDVLIIDEASQCDIVSAIPLFYRAKHVVIIGDPFQLKHISLLTEQQDRHLAETHHISEELFNQLSYTLHSLYDVAEEITKKNNQKPILLNEHYRCHHDIVEFSNEYYYNRKLSIATDETRLLMHPTITKRILWHQVKGKTVHAKSPYNEEEAERVVEETLNLLNLISEKKASIGIVTLFRAQTDLITEKLQKFQDLFEQDITVGTAHRFQGDEKDIILFSPAISEGAKPGTLHWIQTTNQLLNVAVTRARSLFVIIGDQEVCRQTTGPLRNLSDYVDLTRITLDQSDSLEKKTLDEAFRNHQIPAIPNYLIAAKTPFHVDFALFVNGKRYAIQIRDHQRNRERKSYKDQSWKFRWFTEEEVLENTPSVIEEIKRLC